MVVLKLHQKFEVKILEPFGGTVVKIPDKENEYYKIEYEDGDSEEMDVEEVAYHAQYWQKLLPDERVYGRDRKKQKLLHSSDRESMSEAKERFPVGTQVAKDFDKIYEGKITNLPSRGKVTVFYAGYEEKLTRKVLLPLVEEYLEKHQSKQKGKKEGKQKKKQKKVSEVKEKRMKQVKAQNGMRCKSKPPRTSEPSDSGLFRMYNVDIEKCLPAMREFLPPALQDRAAHLGEFLLFCTERQSIWWKRRMHESPPWTKDELLRKRLFTNIFRELDAGTIYFRRHVLQLLSVQECVDNEDFRCRFGAQIVWASILYRCLGKIRTFEELNGIPTPCTWVKFRKRLKQLHDKKVNLFTPAYNVMGANRLIKLMDQLYAKDQKELKKVTREILELNGDLKAICKIFMRFSNVKEFYAWQITCDLMESGMISCDDNTSDYVLLGPGACAGLDLVFGPKNVDMSDIDLCVIIRESQHDILKAMKCKFDGFDGNSLSLKAIEHALCEFCKYLYAKSFPATENTMRIYKAENGNALVTSMGKDRITNCMKHCATCFGVLDEQSIKNKENVGSLSARKVVCNSCKLLTLGRWKEVEQIMKAREITSKKRS